MTVSFILQRLRKLRRPSFSSTLRKKPFGEIWKHFIVTIEKKPSQQMAELRATLNRSLLTCLAYSCAESSRYVQLSTDRTLCTIWRDDSELARPGFALGGGAFCSLFWAASCAFPWHMNVLSYAFAQMAPSKCFNSRIFTLESTLRRPVRRIQNAV